MITEIQQKILQKQRLARDIVTALRSASDSRIVQGLAARIELCATDKNQYIGKNMFDGKRHGRGTYWKCNSRLCPGCVASLARPHRADILYCYKNIKLMSGEDWFTNAFTMPDSDLKDLTLVERIEVFNEFWEKFTHCETDPDKPQTWYQKHFRGGFKSGEFTVKVIEGKNESRQIHVHAHCPMVGKSSICDDDFYRIRKFATRKMKAVWKSRGWQWKCRTSDKRFRLAYYFFLNAEKFDLSETQRAFLLCVAALRSRFLGLVNLHVQKLDKSNLDKAIRECAKYVTKSDSWLKLPKEQLAALAENDDQIGRLFESFGICRAALAKRNKEQREARAKRKAKLSEPVKPLSKLDIETKKYIEECRRRTYEIEQKRYIYPTNLKPSFLTEEFGFEPRPPPDEPKKRENWREKCARMTPEEYRRKLEQEFEQQIEFRQAQLAQKFPEAIFLPFDSAELSRWIPD